MKRKKYEKALRKLQVRLCHLQDWVKEKGLRVVIVFEGRDGAGKGGTIRAHHRARQPARVPRRRAAGAVGSREVADVHAALHAALSPPPARSSSSTAAGTTAPASSTSWASAPKEQHAPVPRALPADREVHRRGRHHADQALARGQQRRAEAALRGAHRGSGAAVEAEPDGPAVAQALVRLLAGPRPDAGEDRHRASRRGTSCDPTTSARRGSTPSRTCCRSFRTRSCRARRSSCPTVEQGRLRRREDDRTPPVGPRACTEVAQPRRHIRSTASRLMKSLLLQARRRARCHRGIGLRRRVAASFEWTAQQPRRAAAARAEA